MTDRGFETRAIHAAGIPDPLTGAVVTPISLATTFAQHGDGEAPFEYSRSDNPTRSAYERTLASLEGADHGVAFASGLAATDALLRSLLPGDHVIIPDDAYGGTYRLVASVFAPTGVTWTAVDFTSADALDAAWRDETRLVWVETPSNPLLKVVDVRTVAAAAHDHDAVLVVDNTFATPYLQRPLEFGADVVVHSATKYLGGHSDVVGGFVATNDSEIAESVRFLQNAAGAVPSPFDCYLLLRGLKTLAVRMDRHQANAARVVELLESHRAVAGVRYPGFGGMVSFHLAGGADAALHVARSTNVFTLAESLGAVESLIEHPATMTHVSVHGSALQVPADLVRLSVGIESIDDLLADLSGALDASH